MCTNTCTKSHNNISHKPWTILCKMDPRTMDQVYGSENYPLYEKNDVKYLYIKKQIAEITC